MFYHKDKKIFIHIPKTAGSSVETRLLEKDSVVTGGGSVWGSIPPEKKKIYLGVKYNEMKYAPHAKAYELKSLYLDLWNDYESSAIVRNPYDRFCSMYFWYTKNGNRNPKEVHDELISRGEMMADLQCEYTHDQDKIIVDRIFRLEKIDEVFNYFDIEPAHKKNMKRQKTLDFYQQWPDMYSFIAEYYSKDFEAFGYDK